MEQLAKEFDRGLLDKNGGSLKKGISEFFLKSRQEVSVAFLAGGIQIKKTFAFKEKGEVFDRIFHHNNVLLLEASADIDQYKALPYLVILPEPFREKLSETYRGIEGSDALFRETTREQVEALFNLCRRSIVLFLRHKIYIRYFVPPKKFPPGVEKRFAGESEEQMQVMYERYFPEGAWEYIESYIDDVLKDKLNFSRIDNQTFTATFTTVFCAMVDIMLLEHMDEADKEKAEGFCGYVLRINFNAIMMHVAKNLLDYVERRDDNAEAFIKYFSDDIVVDASGKKIQKYAIVDTNRSSWNYSAILSVLMQWKQVNNRIAQQKSLIREENDFVAKADEELKAELHKKEMLHQRLEEIDTALSALHEKVDALQYKIKSGEDKESAKRELSVAMKESDKLLEEKKVEANEESFILNRCTFKEQELFRRKKKLESEKKNLEEIRLQSESVTVKYKLIVNALATALSRR